MAYDSARRVTVLFGNGGNGETWEWDGGTWTLRVTSGLSSRDGHAMAYDSAREVTVLHAGSGFDDTWEWNGIAWTYRGSGPERNGHAMAYDSVRGVTVLFGGIARLRRSRETWEWDGSGWTLQTSDGPSAREDHAMAFDSARRVTVLDGVPGRGTWEWDGSLWTLRATNGPGSSELAYDSARRLIVALSCVGTWEYGEWCDGNETIGKVVCKCPNLQKLIAKGTATAGQEIVVEGDNDLGSTTVTANDRNKLKAVFKSTVVCGRTYQLTATFECGLQIDKTATCQ